jgi:hypothetical protein
MWESRDIALVIILAVTSFIYTVFLGQLGNLFTGILGFNYLFIIGHAIIISFSFLIYEGRRWRFLLQSMIVALLTLPTFQSGAPFDLLARAPMIIGSFFADAIFNSLYPYFCLRNKVVLWAILVPVAFLLITPLTMAVNLFLFYASEAFILYVNVFLLLLPVTMTEAIIGGFVGYKIFKRIPDGKSMKYHSDQL